MSLLEIPRRQGDGASSDLFGLWHGPHPCWAAALNRMNDLIAEGCHSQRPGESLMARTI